MATAVGIIKSATEAVLGIGGVSLKYISLFIDNLPFFRYLLITSHSNCSTNGLFHYL